MATREALSVAWHAPTGTPRGAGRAGRVADGLVLPRMPGNAGGGKEPWFESDAERGEGMATGESLAGPESVRKLQTVLHAKAKEEPERRFHALVDKVWREDCLSEAWRRVSVTPTPSRATPRQLRRTGKPDRGSSRVSNILPVARA